MAESGTAQRRRVDYEDVGSDYHGEAPAPEAVLRAGSC